MKVICKKTTSQGFDLKEVTTIFSNEFDYGYHGSGLELNKEYLVMGIAMFKDSNCLYYLIDVNTIPDLFPYLLFDIVDNSIPQNWFMRVNGKKDDIDFYSICGFDEFCNDRDFYERLMDREEKEMRIYFRRKIELEKELELKKELE